MLRRALTRLSAMLRRTLMSAGAASAAHAGVAPIKAFSEDRERECPGDCLLELDRKCWGRRSLPDPS